MEKPRLLLVGSLPPPYSGYETATEVLMGCGLDKDFQLELVDTRTTRNPSMRGRVTLGNFASMVIVWGRLVARLLRYRPHICNVPLAQNRTGFLKWFLLAATCKAFGARVVSRLGGAAFDSFYNRSGHMMKAIIRIGLRLPDRIIVRGPSLTRQFNGLVDNACLDIVPNGFDLHRWEDAARAEVIRSQASGKIEVLYLGQVSRAKGVFDLLAAIANLYNQGRANGFHFVIAGPVIEKERNLVHLDDSQSTSVEIERFLHKSGIKELVEFVGEVSWDEKRELYAWADVVVLPSYSEGLPYTVLEAIASGCVVVCTPVGALGDYLCDEEQVLFVPQGCPTEIARCLVELEDARLRERLVQKAQDYLSANHGLEVFANRMRDVFNAALGKVR